MVCRSSMFSLCVVAASLLSLGGCATTDAAGVDKSGANTTTAAVPSNYRSMVARYIAAKVDRGKVLQAEISRPGLWEGPLGLGGVRPIVCAKWKAQGSLIQQNYSLGFTFKDGQIAEAFDPETINPAAGGAFAAAMKNAATCGKLSYSPFPELVKSK